MTDDSETKRQLSYDLYVELTPLIKNLSYKYDTLNKAFEDLSQEAFFAIIEALKKFNPDKGDFSSYCYYWLKNELIKTTINPITKITRKSKVLISKIKAAYCEIILFKEKPSIQDIHIYTGIELKQIQNLLPYMSLNPYQEEYKPEVDEISDDEITHKINLTSNDMETLIKTNETPTEPKEIIHQLLKTLHKKDQEILKSYYGFNGNPKTLEELGKELGITKQGAHIRIKRILEKIRTQLNIAI